MERRSFFQKLGLAPFFSLGSRKEPYNISSFTFSPLPESISEIKELASLSLSEDALLYLNGGSEDLITLNLNESRYDNISLSPRYMIDVSKVSIKTKIFDRILKTPIFLSPVANLKFFHNDGELAVARASNNTDAIMIVSSLSNYSITEIQKLSKAELWFQLYMSSSRNVSERLIKLAENSGISHLVVTVDSPVVGIRRGFSKIKFGNIEKNNYNGSENIIDFSILNKSLTWQDISWIRSITDMKIILKGIVNYKDALLCLKYGIDGIIVSNHGGRQLETNRATIDCLKEIVEAIEGKIPILIDGGIRSGRDIFKAIALGANGICIGRPFCWGLACSGQTGVERVVEILINELMTTMQLSGVTTMTEINEDYLIYN